LLIRKENRVTDFALVAAIVVFMLCQLYVVGRMFVELFLNCSEAFSNDYFKLIVSVNRLTDVFPPPLTALYYGSHFLLTPLLSCIVNALFFAWSIRLEIAFGVCIFLVRTIFAWLIIFSVRDRFLGLPSVFYLLFLLSLQFSPVNISLMDYPMSSLPSGLTTVGFVIALWCLLRGKNNSVVLMGSGLSALFASYSLGTFVPVWLTLVVVALLQKIKLRRLIVCWTPFVVMSILPYLAFLLCEPGGAKIDMTPGISVPRFLEIVGLLLDNTAKARAPIAALVSAMSLCFAVCATAFVLNKRSQIATLDGAASKSNGAIGLMLYSVTCCLLISLARSSVGPWYIAYSILFWFGLLGLLPHFCLALSGRQRLLAFLRVFFAFALLMSTVRGVWQKFGPQDYFDSGRSMAAEATLRNIDIAPTDAYLMLNGSDPLTAREVQEALRILIVRGWGHFWKKNSLSLQSEYGLPQVVVHTKDAAEFLSWREPGKLSKTAPYTAARALCLRLPACSSLDWTPRIKASAYPVFLHLSFRAESGEGRASIKVIERDSSGELLARDFFADKGRWQSVEIPVMQSRTESGTTISIKAMASTVLCDGITVKFGRETNYALPVGTGILPANVERSRFFPTFGSRDLVLSSRDLQPQNMKVIAENGAKTDFIVDSDREILSGTYVPPLNVDPSTYSHFVFTLLVPPDDNLEAACIQLVLNNSRVESVLMPLVLDGKEHSYAKALKTIGFTKGDRITGLKILPVYLDHPHLGEHISLGQIRFVAER
jgi:hypothetical protein